MRNCRSSIARLAGVMLLVGPVWAAAAPDLAPAPLDPAPPGTRVIWVNKDTSVNYSITVKPSDGEPIRWETEIGEDGEGFFFCLYCADKPYVVDKYSEIWPLEVGKEVKFNRRYQRGRWGNRVTVTGTETLSLPFGDVDTYVIDWYSFQRGGGWNGSATIWYAPSIGWVVRYEYSDTEDKEERHEVVEVVPPD